MARKTNEPVDLSHLGLDPSIEHVTAGGVEYARTDAGWVELGAAVSAEPEPDPEPAGE